MDLDIDAITARLAAAIAAQGWNGEVAETWRVMSRGGADGEWEPSFGYDIEGIEQPDVRGQFAHRSVAEFIAASREDIAALIAEVGRLRALPTLTPELAAALDAFADQFWSYHFQAGVQSFGADDAAPDDGPLWATMTPLHAAWLAAKGTT